MQLCVRDSALTDLPLNEHNQDAFRLLFNINKFRGCVIRNHQFYFYDNDSRNHHQIREAVDVLKHQIKDICFRMFCGEVIQGKTVLKANDIVCMFKLIGYQITASQITGKIPTLIWRLEF